MKRIFLTAVTFALFLVVNGQEMSPLIPEVIPPGPTAAELGRYGIVPVNMHTGNTNISIPLYEFTTKNLSVPISLSYNSSAIQVDEVASWRSEEHTSELQSRENLVCRLLLEKKKKSTTDRE